MMKIFRYPSRDDWDEIIKRPASSDLSIHNTVEEILHKVKKEGDSAVNYYSQKFDKVQDQEGELTNELKEAIQLAKKNIETFHRAQLEEVKKIETMPGVFCWRKSVPIESVGLYIPGGTAPLFSTVLMLAVPAQIAGCREIILCTPSRHPAILYCAEICGVTRIIQVGGAQAIAAMAYGTASIPRVNKIFGPGNMYVTLAKQLVQSEGIAIDLPAGPSELLIIADDSANAEFIAADLISQAEHGQDSQVILLTTSEKIMNDTEAALQKQLKVLARKEVAEAALRNSSMVLLPSIDDCLEFSNRYAPEHLILACEDISDKVINAGSVFIGNYTPEAAGDYASGTNHTLPTNGYAASYSGVSLDSFMKKISFQHITRSGLKNISKTVMLMAETEGLNAHKNAVAVRL